LLAFHRGKEEEGFATLLQNEQEQSTTQETLAIERSFLFYTNTSTKLHDAFFPSRLTQQIHSAQKEQQEEELEECGKISGDLTPVGLSMFKDSYRSRFALSA